MTVAAITHTSPLGPQCAKCRKRRVKCDSTTPHCRRCRRDNLQCPGYATRQSKWTVATPANIKTTVLKARPKASSRGPTPKPTARLVWPSEGPLLSAMWKPLLPLLDPPPTLSTPEDLTLYQFSDSLAYWTTVMRPTLLACAIPGQPREMPLDEWACLPRIMQHGLVSVVSSHRLARGHQGTEIVSRMHDHYARALGLLRRYLTNLKTPPGWSVLVLVAMMLGSEASMTDCGARSGWLVHLEAAWTLIRLQGGIVKGVEAGQKGKWNSLGGIEALVRSWRNGIEPELACTHILQIEIFSTTTCPKRALVRRPGLREALTQGLLEGLEDRLLLAVSPCPLPLMVTLAEVNELRLDLYGVKQQADQAADAIEEPASDPSRRLWAILTTLLCFDSPAWAADVYERHPPYAQHPTHDTPAHRTAWHRAWIALADAYRSAALIYFIRALECHRLKTLFPETYTNFTQGTSTILASHRQSLSDSLAILVASYDGGATPTSTSTASADESIIDDATPNLARFVSWPLFIDAYEAVAWGEHGSGDTIGQDKICRLNLLGRELGVSCLLDAAALLEGLSERRVSGCAWQWEDAFEWRCIFAV